MLGFFVSSNPVIDVVMFVDAPDADVANRDTLQDSPDFMPIRSFHRDRSYDEQQNSEPVAIA